MSGLSGFFSSRGIDIGELSTRSYAAAHTGAQMFSVYMVINVPDPHPRRRAARGVHGLLRPDEPRRDPRAGQELSAMPGLKSATSCRISHSPTTARRVPLARPRRDDAGRLLLPARQHARLHAGGQRFPRPRRRPSAAPAPRILGISTDTLESHRAFRDKMKFPFELGSDEDHAVASLFGVWKQKNMYGRKMMGIERSTFLIDAEGGLRANGARSASPAMRRRSSKRRERFDAAMMQARHRQGRRRAFVLDTNVLMHDPAAMFRFEEHDVYLPMGVLEELDAGKKGLSEVGAERAPGQPLPRRADGERDQGRDRQRPRAAEPGAPATTARSRRAGRLYFQTRRLAAGLPDTLPGQARRQCPARLHAGAADGAARRARVTLVSKDINLRIKAAILGVHAEDYFNDRTIEDADLLFTGVAALPADFWETHGNNVESWQDQARTFYRVRGPAGARMAPEPVPVRATARRHSRRSCARSRRRGRDARGDAGLPQRAPRGLGHHGAQPRAESRAQPAARPGDRFRHDPRPRRHRQDAADARRGPRADARHEPLQRNHHDARDDPARRGHRLPARHRGGKDGALDGRADGQPRGADPGPGRRQLGPRRDAGPAAPPHQDPLAQFHARPHLPEPLPDPRRGAEPHARSR